MSVEEAFDFINKKREGDAVRSRKYYNETVKNDPEKYQRYLEKCKRANTKQREKKQIDVEKPKKEKVIKEKKEKVVKEKIVKEKIVKEKKPKTEKPKKEKINVEIKE